MSTAINQLAGARFANNKSDAVRFLLTKALLEKESPRFRATVAAYQNIYPKMLADVAGLTETMTKAFNEYASKKQWK